MGSMKIDTKDIEKLVSTAKKMQNNMQKFCVDTVSGLANRTIKDAKENTTVDTGEMLQGWFNTPVNKNGNEYSNETKNDASHASYEENGRRTRIRKDGTRGWVPGKFMLLKATLKVQRQAPNIIKSRWKKFVGGK